jgi:multiple sugar transport system permease protein
VLYSFLAPSVLFLAVFALYPILMMAVFSFQRVNLAGLVTGNTPFIGLENYQKIVRDPIFWQSARTSLIFTVASVVFQFIFGFLLALLFNQKFPLAKPIRGLVMVGWVIPIIVSSTVFKWIFQQNTGILNHVLLSLHVIPSAIPWLTDARIALLAPIIANIWLGIPFDMALLLAGLQSISPTLYEAGKVDGANVVQRLWYLTLPLMRSSCLIVLTLGVIYTLNVFDLIYILTGGGPANATNVLPIYAYQQAFSFFNMGAGAAVTMLMFVFLLVVSTIYLFLTRREGRNA